ncbi:hypothetical protein IT414_01230 [bacterium]|nr:hypothetical protein [bacterium]
MAAVIAGIAGIGAGDGVVDTGMEVAALGTGVGAAAGVGAGVGAGGVAGCGIWGAAVCAKVGGVGAGVTDCGAAGWAGWMLLRFEAGGVGGATVGLG